jgi:hypothetical protein
MRSHAALGQRSRVQRWYELCAATLRRELDLSPAVETTALRRSLLAVRA